MEKFIIWTYPYERNSLQWRILSIKIYGSNLFEMLIISYAIVNKILPNQFTTKWKIQYAIYKQLYKFRLCLKLPLLVKWLIKIEKERHRQFSTYCTIFNL